MTNKSIKKLKPIKRARAKTAWNLCEAVCEAIVEDPRRYDQGTYVDQHSLFEVAQDRGLPECGTVACRAGWIVALHDGGIKVRYGAIRNRANKILGVEPWQTQDLFSGSALESYKEQQGRPTYAQYSYLRRRALQGAWGLRQWMEAHKEHLQSRHLKDVK